MNKDGVIKYGKYISRNPYNFTNDYRLMLKWYQRIYFKVLSIFSKKKKIAITLDDGYAIIFKNGSAISCIGNNGCIRGKRANNYSILDDWSDIDMKLVNEVLENYIKEE